VETGGDDAAGVRPPCCFQVNGIVFTSERAEDMVAAAYQPEVRYIRSARAGGASGPGLRGKPGETRLTTPDGCR
jgi:hypothetical protein